MLFSPQALQNKALHLDCCATHLVKSVVRDRLGEGCVLTPLKRLWEPGGGASLFRVGVRAGGALLLKVKHASVLVESRLECEETFSVTPSLRNEHEFLMRLQCESTPAVAFYEEREGFCFLALEWLEPFLEGAGRLSAPELLACWKGLNCFVRRMFLDGMVHTDIHEGNLLLRGNAVVLCDFEEARFLAQEGPFESSLDSWGVSALGDVGQFPAETGLGIAGYTALGRLRLVFQRLIKDKLPGYLASCHFDCDCPFNQDQLQEVDRRVYQSISLPGMDIAGQRPSIDARQQLLRWFLARQPRRIGGLHHLDIGSNLGVFCFLAARSPDVAHSLGLEAYRDYVNAAELLGFVLGEPKVSFREFVCGEDALGAVLAAPVDVCTMLSVYHHIKDKERFLDQLAKVRPRLLIAEFATQERYYPERRTLDAELLFLQERLGYRVMVTVAHSSDYGRPLVLFSDQELAPIDRFIVKLVRFPRLLAWTTDLLETIRSGSGRRRDA